MQGTPAAAGTTDRTTAQLHNSENGAKQTQLESTSDQPGNQTTKSAGQAGGRQADQGSKRNELYRSGGTAGAGRTPAPARWTRWGWHPELGGRPPPPAVVAVDHSPRLPQQPARQQAPWRPRLPAQTWRLGAAKPATATAAVVVAVNADESAVEAVEAGVVGTPHGRTVDRPIFEHR